MLPSLSQLPIGAHGGEDTDSDSSSSDDSGSEIDEAPVAGALHRSYLKFTVSQDPHNQSFLAPSQFAKLDLYQIDALRDNDDPLALKKEMQGATRHFPCHVFWSRDLGKRGYAVWGRPTVGQHEQEAVIAMLETQREERVEYARIVNERKWQRECERKMRTYQLESSAQRAADRARSRRLSETVAPEQPPEASREAHSTPTKRIASIVHRIARRYGSETLTTSEAQTLVNRGLKRLGLGALVVGSFALMSAVAYMQLLQTAPADAEDPPLEILLLPATPALATNDEDAPLGILPTTPPYLAASAEE
jgi:hypothetical protein